MFGKLLGSVTGTVDDFITNPVGTTVDMATQPLRDGADLLEGMTEGEFRHRPAVRLGADVVAGMVISEIIDELS